MNFKKLQKSPILAHLKSVENELKMTRSTTEDSVGVDVSFNEFAQEYFSDVAQLDSKGNPIQDEDGNDIMSNLGIESMDDFLYELGFNPSVDTILSIDQVSNNITYKGFAEYDFKWLIPEIYRESIRLGLRNAPIYPSITAMETSANQLSIIMPYINMSDSAPRRVGEAETIGLGTVSMGQKSVSFYKIGRGIKIPYEVLQYVSIDVISLFFEDFGVKMGMALDTWAIDTLINGEQSDGSASADVIGVKTVGTKTYKDMLKLWVRASRLGRNFNTAIGGEEAAMDTLDLPEFKDKKAGTPEASITMHTPVPNSMNYYVHGNVPTGQEIFLDTQKALFKYNIQPLLVESDRIVSNQTIEVYATVTTGFAKYMKDAVIIMDKSKDFATNGFPAYFNVDEELDVVVED